MELMSSLLLCAFLACVPQALGLSNPVGYSYYEPKNETTVPKKMKMKVGKNIMVNVNVQAYNNKASDLQAVFTDPACQNCIFCMERVVKAHKVNHVSNLQAKDDFQETTLVHMENKIRDKRSLRFESEPKKAKKAKGKKSVSVIKYNENGEIYALKVKETNNQLLLDERNLTKTFSSTCQVYSIQKSLPCDSPEADLILTASKRKTNKKNKKVQGKRETNVPTEEATVIASAYRKRHVDNSEVQEPYLTSLEQMY